MIEISSLQKTYQKETNTVRAINGIDLRVRQNEMVAIMGKSGSGKTTLLHIVGLLDRPTSGVYRLAGKDISSMDDDEATAFRSLNIGFIFQSFHLVPELNVFENVALPFRYRKESDGATVRAVERAIFKVGLRDRAKHRPSELSGGEQQRAAIARAIAGAPSLLLADEPTGNLDSPNSRVIVDLLKDIHAEGATVIIVTHSEEVASHSGRCVRLSDGRVVSDTLQ